MRSALRGLALLWLIATAATVHAATPDFTQCVLCHGVEGNGNPGIRAPRIAGMEPWYIRAQLEAFAAGRRGAHPTDMSGQEMRPVAANFLEIAGIDRTLAFVATFKPLPPPVTVSGDKVRGKSLYVTCAACHGATGKGNETLHAPALAARTDWYLVTQLRNYRSGARGYASDDVYGAQMRTLAATLPDERAIADVVSYINTLR